MAILKSLDTSATPTGPLALPNPAKVRIFYITFKKQLYTHENCKNISVGNVTICKL